MRSDGDEDVFIASGFNATTNQSEFGIIRRSSDGSFSTLVDHNTIVSHPIFSGTTTFSFIDAVDVFENDVFFSGRVSTDNYLYRLGSGGTPQLIEQLGTSPRTFRNLRVLANGDVVMHGSGTSSVFNNPGFYKNSGGTNTTIANRNTAVPSGTGNFDIDSFQSSRGDIGKNGSILFHGDNGAGLFGVYSDRSGTLSVCPDLDRSGLLPDAAAASQTRAVVEVVGICLTGPFDRLPSTRHAGSDGRLNSQ
ncbi:MAG: hypothetical protein F9B45_01275 [Phycisphaera sp. RhM]|nr:hypothetical protein [Phycisphaera sp. RhM]